MPSASGGSGLMSWKACEPAWRRGWRCTISVSGSTSNLVVLGWLSLICWSGDLNSHQAFKRRLAVLPWWQAPDRGEAHRGEVLRITLQGCEYPGEWLWATPRLGLTLLLGEPMVPWK